MREFFFQYEAVIRVGTFFGIFALLALWEIHSPRRKLLNLRRFRWISNFGLIVISSILVRFIFPTAAVGLAILTEKNQWGLLYYLDLPEYLHFVLAFILLDLSLYFQHVMFHALPVFWRFHRVHHTDLDCDVTTGLRFHPFEMLISMLIKFFTIVSIGAPVMVVVVFEIILNAASMFTHSNIRIPKTMEGVIRWLIVTPDMHRTHHSMEETESNSNFGFFISAWDRLFGTYLAEPREGHEVMQIGVKNFRKPHWQNLRWLLYLPFVSGNDSYAINRRKTN